MKAADNRKLCRIIIVNQIDAAGVDLGGLTAQIRETFGPECLPINLPADGGRGSSTASSSPSRREGGRTSPRVAEAHGHIIDQVVEVDEALMELYLEQGSGACSPSSSTTPSRRRCARAT